MRQIRTTPIDPGTQDVVLKARSEGWRLIFEKNPCTVLARFSFLCDDGGSAAGFGRCRSACSGMPTFPSSITDDSDSDRGRGMKGLKRESGARRFGGEEGGLTVTRETWVCVDVVVGAAEGRRGRVLDGVEGGAIDAFEDWRGL